MSENAVSTDIRLKDFWRNNDRFADLANAVIFHGSSIIKPESLHELDTDVSEIVEYKDYEESVARIRDVVKKTAYGVDFVILSLEDQKGIHYGMPLRSMIYDGLGYLKEYRDISRKYKNTEDKDTKEETEEAKEAIGRTIEKGIKRKKRRLEKDEFLSKFKKEDRLHPIISIVISYSEKPWDGPVSLRDMMKDMPPEMKRLFSDYRMNLVEVRDSEQYIFHNEDVKAVFEICREIFHGNLDVIWEKYADQDISVDAAVTIQSITNMSSLYDIRTKGVESMNMCTALEELKNEGREEGRRITLDEDIVKLLRKGFSEESVADMLEVTKERIMETRNRLTGGWEKSNA